MRAVIQRVTRAKVVVDSSITGEITMGILLFLGVAKQDSETSAAYLVEKISNLRIFPDDAGKMNLSLLDVGGSLLVVSQFTLYGDCRKGRRPSFDQAAAPGDANRLYEYFVSQARNLGIPVQTGVFQAHMEVELLNDGPVTLIIESVV